MTDTLEVPDETPKKRGRTPKVVVAPKIEVPVELKDSGVPPAGKRMTQWENSIFCALIENSVAVPRELIEKATDEDAKQLGAMVLACMQEERFWVKRSEDKKFDFVMRFNLEEKASG